MGTPFTFPLSAALVGTYFVGQYYHVLETKPQLVYQFYSDASTMLRIDGNARDTATAMLQIHALVMSLSFTGIEIKTAEALESWSGGVFVMVSGSVQLKDYSVRRKFMQTFLLTPQEKCFFVLNDIFHFVGEEPAHHHQPAFLAQCNLNSKLNAHRTIKKPVSNYLLGGDIQARDFVATNEVKENGAINHYGFSQQQVSCFHDSERIQEDVVAEESHGSLQPTANAVQEHVPSSAEEPPEEHQKHTYASILRVAKGQATPSSASQPSQKHISSLDWDHAPVTNSQQTTALTNAFERSETDVVEKAATTEDKGYYEIKSVYVGNLSPTVSASEIEEEFKNFGRIRPDGVVIRSRKAGSVEVAGRQVYIEQRRPTSNIEEEVIEEVEVGVAINQRHKNGVLVQGALAGEMAKKKVNRSITNPKETVTVDPIHVKKRDIQGIKDQEMVRIVPDQHKIYQENHILRSR